MTALWDVTYDGITGHIAFDDENGDAVRDLAYVKHCNTETGAWIWWASRACKSTLDLSFQIVHRARPGQ